MQDSRIYLRNRFSYESLPKLCSPPSCPDAFSSTGKYFFVLKLTSSFRFKFRISRLCYVSGFCSRSQDIKKCFFLFFHKLFFLINLNTHRQLHRYKRIFIKEFLSLHLNKQTCFKIEGSRVVHLRLNYKKNSWMFKWKFEIVHSYCDTVSAA